MLPTGGDGSASIKWNAASKQWEIRTGNSARVTVTDAATTIGNAVTFSGDVTIPGGVPQTFTFFKEQVLQAPANATQMTGSVMSGTFEKMVSLRYPMVRSGSILGITLYSENGLVISGSAVTALTASVTLDGANTAVSVVITTGSVGHFIQAKDTTTFNGGQAIGVSLTSSDGYESQDGVSLDSVSASWTAAVLVEY